MDGCGAARAIITLTPRTSASERARGREKESLFSAHIIMTAAGRQAIPIFNNSLLFNALFLMKIIRRRAPRGYYRMRDAVSYLQLMM
jgi:hypothetical protein